MARELAGGGVVIHPCRDPEEDKRLARTPGLQWQEEQCR